MFKLLVIIKLYARVNISLQNIFYFSKANNLESALKLQDLFHFSRSEIGAS